MTLSSDYSPPACNALSSGLSESKKAAESNLVSSANSSSSSPQKPSGSSLDTVPSASVSKPSTQNNPPVKTLAHSGSSTKSEEAHLPRLGLKESDPDKLADASPSKSGLLNGLQKSGSTAVHQPSTVSPAKKVCFYFMNFLDYLCKLFFLLSHLFYTVCLVQSVIFIVLF